MGYVFAPMRPFGCALICTALLAVATPASALSGLEKARLAEGESIVEPATLLRDDHRFVGGVTYRVVDADAARLSQIIRSPERWRELLPRVSDVRLGRIDEHGRGHVRLTHSFGPFTGSYSVVIAFTDRGRSARFWIDKTEDNALSDGWGFMRLTPLPGGKTLVTWGVLFDLGDGVTRSLFESKIQRLALEFPRRLAHAATH
jgi:hypothetical protein